MTKPKYQIGDRIADSPFTVCGVLTLSNGTQRYFVQCGNSDNTLVGTEDDLEGAIALLISMVKNAFLI